MTPCLEAAAREIGVQGDRVSQLYDAIVIGGGLVGSAIAYGLARAGLKPVLIDEGDVAFRASRGNFGLVWVQSKGLGAPHYQRWTRLSSEEWPSLAAELRQRTGIDIGHERPGGVHLCLSDAEFEERRARMEQMRAEAGNFGFDFRMLDHRETADLLPGIGPTVVGASFTQYDGHANSLNLLHALHRGFTGLGGMYLPNRTIADAGAAPRDFRLGRRRDRRAGGGAHGGARQCQARAAVRALRPGPAATRTDPGHRARRPRVRRCRPRPCARQSRAAS